MARLTLCVQSFGWFVEHRPGNPLKKGLYPQMLRVSSDRCTSGSQQRSTPRIRGIAVVEIWGTQTRQKTTPNRTYALHLRAATAPDKQPRTVKSRDAPGGVYDDVGCASQQS